LKADGRLRERDFHADYRFLDPRLDLFYEWTLRAFTDRNHSVSGTANLLRLLLFEAKLDLQQGRPEAHLGDRILQLSAISNQLLLDAAEIASRTMRAKTSGCART
jgi:hypothetical protein